MGHGTSKEELDEIFSYHSPTEKQQERLVALRTAARTFADAIVNNTMQGPDQTAAIRKLRECVMTANASIVLEDVLP